LAGVPLPVDPMLINQVLTNLMRNAIEAMNGTGCLQVQLMATSRPSPEADPVEVDHPHESEFIAISIIDEGPGIAPEVLERVFNPFFTTRPHGTGLGLAIAHRIADAHEGVIELRNRTEGGLQATLHLPRRCHTAVKDADADDDVTARRIAAAMSGEIDPRLLLDDDDDDNDGIGSLCARHETDCHEMITNPGTCDRADRSGEANRLIADEGGMNPDPTLDSTVAACSANEVATQHRPEGGRLGKARRRPDAGAAAHRTFRSRSAAPR